MNSVVEGLMSQMMSKENLSLLSNKAGTDEKSAKSALEIGLPMLLAAMSNKASKSEGSAIISSLSQPLMIFQNYWVINPKWHFLPLQKQLC